MERKGFYKYKYIIYWGELSNCVGEFFELLKEFKDASWNKQRIKIIKEMISKGYVEYKLIPKKHNIDLLLMTLNRETLVWDYLIVDTKERL